MKVEPGDIFEALNGRHHPCDGPTRIKVLTSPKSALGFCGPWMVEVVTLASNGREVRRRKVDTAKLYESRTRDDGTERRTGYVRVENAAPPPSQLSLTD